VTLTAGEGTHLSADCRLHQVEHPEGSVTRRRDGQNPRELITVVLGELRERSRLFVREHGLDRPERKWLFPF